jgi:HEAT repeat protein
MQFLCFQTAILSIFTGLFLIGNHLLPVYFPLPIWAAIFVASPTPTPPAAPLSDASLGAIATITGAIIAGLFGILYIRYQAHQNKALERENERVLREKEDMQRRLDAASRRQQFEEDIEKSRYNDWLTARREAQERERQRKYDAHAAARHVMLQARTPAEYDEAYRKALHADANISQLQILDMAHPMEVAKVYVRLRLHQEARLTYDLESPLLEAETRGDPNSLLRAKLSFLEKRTQAALTPESALQKYPRCIVLGDPGAGKSTLLKYLTLCSIDQQLANVPHFPIHISLSDFATSTNQDLIGFAAERWDEWYGFPGEEARTHMESHLASGNALLLLDALDEAVAGGTDEIARTSYRRVLEAIQRVATRYSEISIVITARKAGYYRNAHISGFTELEVLEFRPEEINEFVDNWFAYHPAPSKYATASDLKAQLAQNTRIQSLAANPLLLCLIVMVYESHQDLPVKRAGIYKDCIDALLYRWDTSRDIRRRRKFKIEHKQQLLIEIAWHFHRQGKRYFPEDELLQVIADFLSTVDHLAEEKQAILNEIEEENGLLKEQARGWHGFLHLTLQEYLVAQHLAHQGADGLNELLKHCGDPWWEEVMLLYAGSVSDASPLLRALLKREKQDWPWEDIFHTFLLWAGQCLSAKPRLVQRELRDEIISRLFALLRKYDTPYSLRKQIIKTLLDLDDSDVREKILILIKDRQEQGIVREVVVKVLGELGEKVMVSDLLTMLKDKQEDRSVRRSAVGALGALGEKAVVPELLAMLKDRQNDHYVRLSVSDTLGVLGEKMVVPELLKLLKDKQENDDIRQSVARVLRILGEKAVVPDLLVILKDKQEDAEVRQSVALALKELGEKTVAPDLLALLTDKQEDEMVRALVAQTLGAVGEKMVVPDLLALLTDKQESEMVRSLVAQALGELGEKAVVPDLLALLKDKQENGEFRALVAQALGKLGEKIVVSELLTILKNQREDSYVRQSVAEALRILKGKAVVPELLAVLKNKQNGSRVRRSVAVLLIILGQQETVLPYLSLLAENDTMLNGLAIWNITALRQFTPLLKRGYINYNTYEQFWAASKREKVRILRFKWIFVKFVRIVKI